MFVTFDESILALFERVLADAILGGSATQPSTKPFDHVVRRLEEPA